MAITEAVSKKATGFLAALDKCSEGTLLFLFGTITLNTLVVSIFLGYLVSSIYPSPPKDSSKLVMESLQYELRGSFDNEYSKILVDRLMELERRTKQSVVINLPMNVAAVDSSK